MSIVKSATMNLPSTTSTTTVAGADIAPSFTRPDEPHRWRTPSSTRSTSCTGIRLES
jgi:hypothetical protein